MANRVKTFRVLVSTDLGGDPDDIQSLIHLLHYSDVLRLEGIVSSPGPGSSPDAENIRYWVRRADLDHLRSRGHEALMTENDVVSIVRQGALTAMPPKDGNGTEGSWLIVERANAADPEGRDRPLWVLAWGSLTDIAQALHDDPGIAEKIRIYYIGSSNTTNDPASRDYVYDGMKTTWPTLWWIENGILPKFSHDTFRGYYMGGDQSGEWGNKTFVDSVIRGTGTDHGGEPGRLLGDELPLAAHPGGESGILKEGDTPTFLYLLSPVFGGVGDPDDPTVPSWGGRFRRPDPDRFPNYSVDLDAPAEQCWSTINRWRKAYLSHWKTRWQWYDE